MSAVPQRAVRRALLVACGLVAPLFALALESRAAPEPQPPAVPVIIVQTATCHQPIPEENACYVNWGSIQVASDPGYASYLVAISITLGSRLRANYHGFFQTGASLDPAMHGQGFRVACGPRDASGMGNTYTYRIDAINTNNATASVADVVRCPGTNIEYLPLISR